MLLNTTQSRLSKLEKGSQALHDVVELRYVAEKLGIPPERFGVLPDRSGDARPRTETVSLDPSPVRDSQERWRAVRAELNANRARLGDLAADLYPGEQRIEGTTVLTAGGWVPDEPIDLADIELSWLPESPTPSITGMAAEADTPSLGRLLTLDETAEAVARALAALAEIAPRRQADAERAARESEEVARAEELARWAAHDHTDAMADDVSYDAMER